MKFFAQRYYTFDNPLCYLASIYIVHNTISERVCRIIIVTVYMLDSKLLGLVNFIPFWLAGAEMECTLHVAQYPKWPIKQFSKAKNRS